MTSRAALPGSAGEPEPEREQFGKYEILRRLAVGGMAEIHLARARGIEGFEKLVVLKRILPQLAESDEFVQMFLDEARLAAHLHHSNIVQVYDIGRVHDQYFLSMEFLHGQDVRHITKTASKREQPVPLEHALTILIGVLAGLRYAHTRVVNGQPLNLVHRDVSPQNVFVTYDGGVKLLDFGIARASSRLSETRTGTLKGKTSYMSPEQAEGLPLDQRSDLYAASIMLWELTTGRRLYTGDSEMEVLRRIREDDPPRPSSASFAYPLALERIVSRGLKRNREERYASAEEMQNELEAFAREQGFALSPLLLARYMRELYGDRIEAWQEAERAGVPLGDHLAQASGSGRRTSTETSVPPPILKSDPAVPSLPRRSRGFIVLAVAIGLAAGSLGTWLLARRSPRPAPTPPPAAAAPPPPVVKRPAPVKTAMTPAPIESAPIPAPAKSAPEPAPTKSAPEPAPIKSAPAATTPKRAPASDIARAKSRPKRAAHPAAKRRSQPSGWNPDSMLPP